MWRAEWALLEPKAVSDGSHIGLASSASSLNLTHGIVAKKLMDLVSMGLLTCTLGVIAPHAHPAVCEAGST